MGEVKESGRERRKERGKRERGERERGERSVAGKTNKDNLPYMRKAYTSKLLTLSRHSTSVIDHTLWSGIVLLGHAC